ncbi:MAG: radical SAM family heme chaperone HemW [Bacteroidales bacterium]|nr:radical SAM family heme chaperone HemW [Bacteroidales bacterium]
MLYIHIPYCRRKCSYCGFYSLAGKQDYEAYVDALCLELKQRATEKPLKTVYFGGGTPSLLSYGQIERIINTLRDYYDLSLLQEATIEANPENLSKNYIDSLFNINFFNRISIGVQSFDDKDLRAINRIHSSRQAFEAIENAAARFDNISVDLIMGLPGQSQKGWCENLAAISRFGDKVKHLSCYELTVEDGSILKRQIEMGRVTLIDSDVIASMYDTLQDWCGNNGFEQYEVSNYCRPGFHSRHNCRYWDGTPYLGCGAAAHSFDGDHRRWNIADVNAYISGVMQGKLPYEEEILTRQDHLNEYIMTSLRTVAGMAKDKIPSDYADVIGEKMIPFVKTGLIVDCSDAYKPTKEGLLHADGIAASLFVD